jgi:hypothetical protein
VTFDPALAGARGTKLAVAPVDRCPARRRIAACHGRFVEREVKKKTLRGGSRANAALLVWITLILLTASFSS